MVSGTTCAAGSQVFCHPRPGSALARFACAGAGYRATTTPFAALVPRAGRAFMRGVDPMSDARRRLAGVVLVGSLFFFPGCDTDPA